MRLCNASSWYASWKGKPNRTRRRHPLFIPHSVQAYRSLMLVLLHLFTAQLPALSTSFKHLLLGVIALLPLWVYNSRPPWYSTRMLASPPAKATLDSPPDGWEAQQVFLAPQPSGSSVLAPAAASEYAFSSFFSWNVPYCGQGPLIIALGLILCLPVFAESKSKRRPPGPCRPIATYLLQPLLAACPRMFLSLKTTPMSELLSLDWRGEMIQGSEWALFDLLVWMCWIYPMVCAIEQDPDSVRYQSIVPPYLH